MMADEQPAERAVSTPEEVRDARRAKRALQAAQAISFAALLSLFLACSLYLVLAYTGWNQYTAAAALFSAGLAGYPALSLLWFALSSQAFACWRGLSSHDRFTWSQKIPTLIHAAIMTLVGVWVVFFHDWRGQDLIKQRNELVSAFIGLELGYLVQELAIEVEKQRRFHQSFSALHWLHHVSILLALPWYYKYKIGDFFFGAFFLMSASTVPLQCRWFLRTSGLHKGPLVLLNHVLLVISFASCRVALFPYLFRTYAVSLKIPFPKVFSRVPWVCIWGTAVFMSLNAVWLLAMIRRPPRSRAVKGFAVGKQGDASASGISGVLLDGEKPTGQTAHIHADGQAGLTHGKHA